MTFLDILQSKHTNLPIHQKKSTGFRGSLHERLDTFFNVVNSSKNLTKEVNGISFQEAIFKRKLKTLCDGIIKSVNCYYEGKPSLAYQALSKSLQGVKGYLDKSFMLNEGSNLFRIRAANGNYPLGVPDLLHIPFEKRGIVKTQRFSIPGLPSLYLANSIYVAWEELGRPSFENIQAIRLSTARQLQMLDLTNDIYNKNSHLEGNELYEWQLLYKVITWPLVAACSFKTLNPSDTFKPEYIVPQLLMQWINTNSIDGIVYSSTHINPSVGDGSFSNYVIPVQTFDSEKGLCPKICGMFETTDVLPMQVQQFLSIGNGFHGQSTISADVNQSINEIELIKGIPQPYSYTYFGIMEHSLNYMPLSPIS